MRNILHYPVLLMAFVVIANLGSGADVKKVHEEKIPYRKGSSFTGFSAGPSFGARVLGSEIRHDLLFFNLHYGRVFSEIQAEDSWLAGRWAFMTEATVAYQHEPDSARVAGIKGILRYVFEPDGTIYPFIQAGTGLLISDISQPDLGSGFNFEELGGAGAFWLFREDIALSLEYRFIHYSNAGIRSPNRGVNTHGALLGLTRFY